MLTKSRPRSMIPKVVEDVGADVKVVPARNPSKKSPWCNGNEYKHSSPVLRLHKEVCDFARWIAPTEEEKHLRALVIERFKNTVKMLWPSAYVICHGSSATDTYLPGGDLDFVIHRDSGETGAIHLLEQLNSHLLDNQFFRSSEVISAKCPIIKGFEHPFGFHIDIAINNDNGILNIPRNRKYLETFPALYPFLMFTKYFLFENRLDEPYRGGISTNTLQNMLIFIIQQSPIEDQPHVGKLVMNFFKIFGSNFNYVTTGISIREGGRLFSRIDNDRQSWKNPMCLCIEDPQIPGQFLGENCYECGKFRNACYRAFRALMSEAEVGEQSMISRILNPLEWVSRRREQVKAHYQSVLGNVIQSICLKPAGTSTSTGERRDRERDRSRDDRRSSDNYRRDRAPPRNMQRRSDRPFNR